MNQNSPYQQYSDAGTPSYRQAPDSRYMPMNQDDSNMTGDEVKFLKKKYKKSQNKVFHDFFKTKMCPLASLTICNKGESCPYAHNEDELREKPNLMKTKLCDAYLETGFCKNGDQCSFAHGEGELRSTPDLFKTAICNLWNQGKCTSGERCRFAHGVEDLRPAPMHYKSKKLDSKLPPKTTSYRPQQNKVQMQVVQQQPMIYPTYPMQYNPVMMNTGSFPQYNYTQPYQEIQPQFFSVPFNYPGNSIGIGKGPMGGNSQF